jgi:hypothetical protein
MTYNQTNQVKIEGDRYEVALRYLDKLLLFCPDYQTFDLNSVILKYEPDLSKTKEIRELKPEIEELFIKIHNYADSAEGWSNTKLNDIGRYVKLIGGHFAYIEKVNRENKKAESEKKSEKRKNNTAFILSIGAFLISLFATFGLIPSNKESVPLNDNQKKIDSLFRLIENLEKRIDTIYKPDSLINK